ncbi:G-protein coupled receptor Mth2-like isoform X7 [Rhynchophorus ferrugineus]|uniref:G-protein coupled receptor Mth2-like isoform X7 n=1 Tax=Rhynchophorus ferrugineus TaxID=354439 RepID=UPI003FCD8D70
MRNLMLLLSVVGLMPSGSRGAFDLCREDPTSSPTPSYANETMQNCGCDPVCYRKCCKPGYYLGRQRTCHRLDSNHSFFVPLYDGRIFVKTTSDVNQFIVGVLECRYYLLNVLLEKDSFYLQTNGKLLMPAAKGKTVLNNNEYCVDELNGLSTFVCFEDENLDKDINAVGMIISMPFLFITFLVYLILPDKNVHQYALMLYVLTLLLAYVLLVTINLSESLPTFFCTGAAYGTLFLFMVSFFWMNVICFDIWYTFSGGRGYIVSSRKSERKRFLIYTAYAVGIPILHVCIVALLDKYLDEESIHKPNIGIKKCFLDDGWPSLWYMYGEAAILVLINVVFFTLTALKIRQVKKETLMLKQNESKRHALEKEKRRFNLFLKLFLAMGVNWTMEVISWLVNWQTTDKYTYIWYITDFINAVYGGVIFFIFVFKRKIWKMLQKRYYNFIGKPHLARAVTTTTDTRTSHYSSATDTNLTERTNITERRNNGIPTEELALRRA